ncbi:phenylalanine--tRNA ligase subunit beta [Blautia liquoris]|uniref:Phenylalanine--tRNA ligase beta subunit n=1 Tax=Blautia liquoris TaxID=2779518 RepID=A0A7M2RJU5_9FIRM|nr:phenylalanine--tRNA ligase subunit beta [Blautia liquoris]QOV20606.1 phenylalanine--tRNA ligase subunit beta [Blautia liquoris]
MNTSLSWIKRYVPDLSVTAQEYMDAMTLSGTKVEGYETLDEDLDKIVVGEILSVEKHPDSDHLVICQVNVKDNTLQIVTGAPNVKEGISGQKVAVVLDGGKVAGGHDGKKVPGGTTIKTGELRGVKSEGMMCSIEEMGSSREMYPEAPEYGIYIFPEDSDVEPGDDAIEALGLHDSVIEYEITSNRVDCYSVIGIAREAAATFDKEFKSPVITPTGNDENISDYISVDVQDKELCPRYTARVVKNVKIGPSPKWMRRCLASNGIRPINNLVDITNYVMEEYGQPMHAYDLDTISGGKIIVRRAKNGEIYTTLDGQERKLDENILMICDDREPVGIAGIMGGENSMITDHVHTILFEAANFDGTNIRLSSKRLGLRTDASGKFEKGLDPNNASEAINRACQLMEEMGAGEVVGGMIDVCNEIREPMRVTFEPERINSLLGTSLSPQEMLDYMAKVELTYDKRKNEVIAPTFRQDIFRTADLAEEVARFFGYDNIPTTLPSGQATTGKLPFKLQVEDRARDVAEYCGFSQGMSYSFESPKVFDKLLLDVDDPLRKAIPIMNPLGEDFSIMRTITLNGLLTSLAINYNRRNKNVRLYEMGNVYLAKSLPLTELPTEKMMFTLAMYGEGDFYDMKGVAEEFFTKVGLNKRPEYKSNAGRNYLHPGRQADVYYEGTKLGFLGEVHPLVCDNYGIGERTYIAVIDIPAVLEYATFDHKYEGIARFPAVTRDISMVVQKEIQAGQIEDLLIQRGGNILESFELFDVYEGHQIKEGYKSMAYSLLFRSKEKTLEESEITSAMRKIMNGLESLGIELRK